MLKTEPSEALSFHRTLSSLIFTHSHALVPFNQTTVKEDLLLVNAGESPLAYKVKTTAPKEYCVRPNSGLLMPGERKTVKGTE